MPHMAESPQQAIDLRRERREGGRARSPDTWCIQHRVAVLRRAAGAEAPPSDYGVNSREIRI